MYRLQNPITNSLVIGRKRLRFHCLFAMIVDPKSGQEVKVKVILSFDVSIHIIENPEIPMMK